MPENRSKRPVLFLDVDGVISLFGFPATGPPPGRFHWIDGVAHCIGEACGERLGRLAERFALVWATGWEEKANEYLPFLLDLPKELPVLTFDGRAVFGSCHWKLDAIEEYAGDPPGRVDRRQPRRRMRALGERPPGADPAREDGIGDRALRRGRGAPPRVGGRAGGELAARPEEGQAPGHRTTSNARSRFRPYR